MLGPVFEAPTAEAADNAAKELRHKASEIRKRLEQKED
jgi:hypothetical protein